MSWHPNDLVSDTDLSSYERTILTGFGANEWQAKRQKALEDWLFPLLASNGLDPYRLRTRYQPDQVWGVTSSVFSDLTSKAKDRTADTITLNTVLAAGSDYLAVGAPWQFRGLSIRMLDTVNAVASALTAEIWCDAWSSVTVSDGTAATTGKPFSKGGAITWTVPENWVTRPLNGSNDLYFARLRVATPLTNATKCGQISVIRRSALCAAATLRTLAYIFHEAPTQQDGPWKEKADWYEQEAQHAWERSLPLLGREFDTETVDDVIDASEATQTTDTASGGGWSFERC